MDNLESVTSKKDYLKNYHLQKKDTIDKEFAKLNTKMDSIIDLINDTNRVEIELQDDTFDWSLTDVRDFIKKVGEIAEEKYKRKFNNLSTKDKQKYLRFGKYDQIYECLSW
jgi:hypothetical protein